jgi:hypothetical protein
MAETPGRGKAPAERKVDVPAAPTTTFAELASRPPRNSQELGTTPGPAVERTSIDLPAAPVVVDVRQLADRAIRQLASGLDAGTGDVG